MAITVAVIDYGNTREFSAKVRLTFGMAANNIVDGTFPTNITTAADKNTATTYASNIVRGNAALQPQIDAILCVPAVQNLINATPIGDVDAVLLAQAKNQFRQLAGIVTTYT